VRFVKNMQMKLYKSTSSTISLTLNSSFLNKNLTGLQSFWEVFSQFMFLPISIFIRKCKNQSLFSASKTYHYPFMMAG
jgi:hypothetical protein